MDTTTKAIDPVCGMELDPATAAGSSELDGRTYYFCSAGCKQRFDAAPEKYLPSEPPAESDPHAGHAHHESHAGHGSDAVNGSASPEAAKPTQPVVQLTMG